MFTFVECLLVSCFSFILLRHIFYIAVDSTETIARKYLYVCILSICDMSHIEKRGSIPITAVCFDNRHDVLIIVGSMMN